MSNHVYLTKDDVATRLQISVRTLEHMMNDGTIPFLKFRHTVRFSPAIFDHFEKANSRVTA